MPDIVADLKSEADGLRLSHRELSCKIGSAAAEIERLRAALANAIAHARNWKDIAEMPHTATVEQHAPTSPDLKV
jgi:uncharacterized small protein (DUF1192 family)